MTTVPITKLPDSVRSLASNVDVTTATLEKRQFADGSWGLVAVPVEKQVPDFTGSAMVSFPLPFGVAEKLAVPNGLPPGDMHVTIAYLGPSEALTVDQVVAIADVLQMSVSIAPPGPLRGRVGGIGMFAPGEDGTPVWVTPDVQGLAELGADIRQRIAQVVELPSEHGFVPHITLTYLDAPEEGLALPAPPELALEFDRVEFKVGEARVSFRFGEEPQPGVAWLDVARKAASPDVNDAKPVEVSKADAELRYTLGPWYVPHVLDSDAEWTDEHELQAAVWRYVDGGDRFIRLQHNPEIVAGRWVEIMSWPHAIEVPMIDPETGEERTQEFPAGTVFLGVLWEEWSWPLVRNGYLRGYSIGGEALRLMVDLPTST